MIRLTKHGFRSRTPAQPESRVTDFDPTLGYDGSLPPTKLAPGFTPESQNWELDDGYIRPRSGLSKIPLRAGGIGGPALLGVECFDTAGARYGITAHSGPEGGFALGLVQPPDASDWTFLFWQLDGGGFGSEWTKQIPTRAQINFGWQAAQCYEPSNDTNIVVFTNGVNMPKFWNIGAGLSSSSIFWASDLSCVASSFSKAFSVAEFDYRLVFFNTSSDATPFPVRVHWSARGAPFTWTIADGAGFEDLMDMKGTGRKVVAERDSIALFTEEQIWRGRNRRDVYAFDFYPVVRDLGSPYHKTIIPTPYGIVFLGRDLDLYLLSGDNAIPLGPTSPGGPSRIRTRLRSTLQHADLAHAVYNSTKRRYELYYVSSEDGGEYPQRVLHYNFDNQSIFIQKLTQEVTCAVELFDLAQTPTWDSIDFTWDQYNVTWDDPVSDDLPRTITVASWYSSLNTPGPGLSVLHSFRSDRTYDDSFNPGSSSLSSIISPIDCRWRSHGLGSPGLRYDTINEVRVGYESAGTSNVSIWTSSNGGTFSDPLQVALSATSGDIGLLPCVVSGSAPMFELRLVDGSQPRIGRMEANLIDAGSFS